MRMRFVSRSQWIVSMLALFLILFFCPGNQALAGGNVSEQFADTQTVTSTAITQTPAAVSGPVTEESQTVSGSKDAVDKFFTCWSDEYSVEPSINTYFVKGDRGRFREDWWIDDKTTGGAENVTFKGKKGDIKDIKYEFEGHALVDYDYLAHLRLKQRNKQMVDVEWKRFRKYWAGSEDRPWNPYTYRVSPDLENWPAGELHTDRGLTTVQYERSLSKNAKLILEDIVWTRRGRETLLRGEQIARTGQISLRGSPMRVRVKGVSNTVIGRVPFTLAKKHNIEPKVSFEFYRDSQYTTSARYNNGILNQNRDYIDKLQFADLKGQVTYNSFLSDSMYANGGYIFDYLRNDSVRSEIRPNLANPNTYVNPKVDNWRVSNALSLGAVVFDFLKHQGLDFRMGAKGEYAGTDAHGVLSSGGSMAPNSLRFSDSQLKESRMGEVFSLTYDRFKNTTAFLGIEMEQRILRWEETYDARSHESVTVFGNPVPFPHDEEYITNMDFVPVLKLIHRFNSRLKASLIYRWQERHRFYHTVEDNDSRYYPGYLGDGTHRVQDVTTNFDVRLPKAWLMAYKYQFLFDTIEYDKAGEVQGRLDSNRFTATFSGPVTNRLFATILGMYNLYRLDTPTKPEKNRWSPWLSHYDYNGDSAVIGTNLTYLLTKNVNLYAGYQFTGSYGSNRNLLNEVSAGFRYSINPTTTLEARYQVFDFDDLRNPKSYNDSYFGQGMYFALRKSFF